MRYPDDSKKAGGTRRPHLITSTLKDPGTVSHDPGGVKRVTRPRQGGTSSAAVQDTLSGIERRPSLTEAERARRRHQRPHRWNRFMPTLLVDRGEFGACPLRVDDELEWVELLILLPQPVEGLTAEMRQVVLYK